jgi:Ca2+-binding RTX toxin-like protein
MKAVELIFKKQFIVTNGTKEIGLIYLSNTFSESDNLTFSITGGVDKDLFSIDATTGVLTFNEQAFVDTALDFDRDGIYDVQITVSGADGDTQTANLGVEVVFDGTAPEISNLELSYEINEDGATVITVTGNVTDDGAGMIDGSLSLYIKHVLTGETIYMPGGQFSSIALGDDGSFSLSQALEANDADGLYFIYYLEATDKAGNAYRISLWQPGGAPATIEVPNSLYLGSADKTAPEISNLELSYEINEDGATVITVTGNVTDDGAGMIDGSLSLYIKHALTGETIYMPGGQFSSIALGDDGSFSLSQALEANDADGLYFIYYLEATDKAGNAYRISLWQPGGAPATIEVPNSLYLGSADKTAPEISNLELSYEINEDGATVITVTGNVTDDGAGMIDGSLSLYIKHALTGETIYMPGGQFSSIALGDDGSFSLSQALEANDADGLYFIYYLEATDKAGNAYRISLWQPGGAPATIEVPNSLYLGGNGGSPDSQVDITAPELSNLELTTYTQDGYVFLKVTGVVTDEAFSQLSLTFKVAGNPSAGDINLYAYGSNNYSGDTSGYSYDPNTGAFESYQQIGDTNVSGTYYLARVWTYDAAQNQQNINLELGSDSPLFGLSAVVDNPNAITDITAPELSNLELTTYTQDGYVFLKVTGVVTDEAFSQLSLTFKVAGNPSAGDINLYAYGSNNYSGDTSGYSYDPNTGAFESYQQIGDTNVSGTYYLARVWTYDAAQNQQNINLELGSDSPLFGLSAVVDNPNAITDITAPELSNLELTTYTQDGYVFLKVTGVVTDEAFSQLSLTFKVAGNPSAGDINLYAYGSNNYSGDTSGYSYDPNTGAFESYQQIGDTNVSGTYYLARVWTYDAAQNQQNINLELGSDSPLFGLSALVAKDAPTSIEITRNNATEINEIEAINEGQFGASIGKITVNGNDALGLFDLTISGADAALLEISPLGYLRLKSSVSLDFDDQPNLSFTITATNTLGESFDARYTLSIVDLQLTPTAVLIDGLSETTVKIVENQVGALVGNLSTIDGDDGDTHTYALAEASEIFEIADNILKLKDGVSLDYANQDSYSISIISTDSTGLTHTEALTILVIRAIDISSMSLNEAEAGALVGDLSVTDASFSNNITFSLSGTDAEQFEIVNGQLKLKANIAADYEVKDSYTLTITAQDDAGKEVSLDFNIAVTDVAEAPSAITLSQQEPEPPAPPPNPGEGETITVVVTVTNNQFYFNGQPQTEFELVKGNTYIFEQSVGVNGHVLGISASDGGASVAGLNYAYSTAFSNNPTTLNVSTYTSYLTNPAYVSFFSNYTFAITYTVPDDGPDTLYFFSASSAVTGGTFNVGGGYVPPAPPSTPVDSDAIVINENELGAMVGTLLTTDEDAGDTHTYTLSGTDADLFEIVDGKLKLKDSMATNYENKSILNIEITATDQTGLSVTQSITVTVNNINEQPTQINLSATSFDEATAGAIVGTLNTEDEDIDDTYVYSLSGTDADVFEIINDQLKLKDSIEGNFEAKGTYTVTITSTDAGGLSASNDFTITVNDVNEPVASISLGTSNYGFVSEGVHGALIDSFITDDPDLNETRTYLLSGRDAHYFEVVDGQLKLKNDVALDYESLTDEYVEDGTVYKYLYAQVTVIDSAGFTAKSDIFYVFVENVNDTPSNISLTGNTISIGSSESIGKISVTDEDDTNFTYAIDNESFEIVDNILRLKDGVSISGEFGDSVIIQITATDTAGNSTSESFNLNIGSVALDNNVFEENIDNATIATISIGLEDLSKWTISIQGQDAKNFKINGDHQLIFIGAANYEAQSSYDIVLVATNNETGKTLRSFHEVNVTDRNDAPTLLISHAYTSYTLEDGAQIFGIADDVIDPYIMTFMFKDEDSISTLDGYSIKITYENQYGETVDITDKFIFDTETGALYFNGSVDFDTSTRINELSGIDESHRWYDLIEISVTDGEGAKSNSIYSLIYATDTSLDGEVDLGYVSSFYNMFYEESQRWEGPPDLDTNEHPSFSGLNIGDFNGDGITDYVASFFNDDYGYPNEYAFIAISLGGSKTFPHYDPTTQTWSGPAIDNEIFGNGLGSVTVRLPSLFWSEYGDVRDFIISELEVGDFNNDGFDDFLVVIDSKFSSGSWILTVNGKNFDNQAPQGTNSIDLSNLSMGEFSSLGSLTYINDLQDYYIEGFVDANNDGDLEIVLSAYDESTDDYLILIYDHGNEAAVQTFESREYDSDFGEGVIFGDFNGDGRKDIAITAPEYTTNDDGGAIYIYLNSFNGFNASPNVTIYGDYDAQIGYWGNIINLGDINGDGRDEIGFSDAGYDYGEWIFWGKSSFLATYDMTLSNTKSSHFTKIEDGDFILDSVNLGDVNGDGFNDLGWIDGEDIVITFGRQTWLSQYENFTSLNDLTINTREQVEFLFPAGDIDGDGRDDFGWAGSSDDGNYHWSQPNFLRIINGFDLDKAQNGFALHLSQHMFSIDENPSAGNSIATISLLNGKNIEDFEVFIRFVEVNGESLENNLFDISSSGVITLKPGVTLDFESAASYRLTIRIVDNDNNQLSQHFVDLIINDINEAPDFDLSSQIFETADAGVVVASISKSDPDNDDITIELSGSDGDKFIYDNETNQISFRDGFQSVEGQISFHVTVNVTDEAGLTISRDIIFEINQAPTDLTLSNNLVQESVRGAAIGQVNVNDNNVDDEHTFAISGEYADHFEVTSEGILKLKGTFYADAEVMGDSVDLIITATDSEGKSVDKKFTINLVDIDYATPSAPDLSLNYNIGNTGTFLDALFLGYTFDPDWDPRTPLIITYSFVSDYELMLDPVMIEYIDGSENLINPEDYGFKEAVKNILAELGSILGITFKEVTETYSQVGDIRFHLFDNPDAGFGGISFSGSGSQYWQDSGVADIGINTSSSADFDPGEYGYLTIMHEIGHSLGLDHTFDDGDEAAITLDDFGRSDLGWIGYTVMDYRDFELFGLGQNFLLPGTTQVVDNQTNQPYYPTTFMPLDYLALFYLYNNIPGTEAMLIPDSNPGDDTYILEGPFFFTINDTGGNDTLDWSAQSWDSTVYLKPFSINNTYLSTFGSDKLRFIDDTGWQEDAFTGWILGIAPYTYIENIKAGSGNDIIYLNEVSNNVMLGEGNDIVFDIGTNDIIYGEEGNDRFYASNDQFALVDGGQGGLDSFWMPATLLNSGIFSVDFRNTSNIKNISVLDYGHNLSLGPGNILISEETFKNFNTNTLIIFSKWETFSEISVGVEGEFKKLGSTDSFDIYRLENSGQEYYLWVYKDHYVFKIDDNSLTLKLSNTILADDAWGFVSEIILSGDEWLSSGQFWDSYNYAGPVFSISGPDADKFYISYGRLYLNTDANYEDQASYQITITATSTSGKTASQEFVIEVKDIDEASYTSGADLIEGSADNDYLHGGSGDDELKGLDGDDHITGGTGNDKIYGGPGDDYLFGWSGNDEIFGEDGDDVIYGHEDKDYLYGGNGDDLIYGWDGNDEIEGGLGDDIIYGGTDDDLIYGDSDDGESANDGHDIIYASTGDDVVWGRGGNDIIYGHFGDDELHGGAGDDFIDGNAGNDTLVGMRGNDELFGSDGDDLIYGDNFTGESATDGSDILWGGIGNDQLFGRGGDDFLVGQSGINTLSGGEGSDTFVLSSYSLEGSQDIIKDYVDGTDKIGLINIDFDSLVITQDANALDTNITDVNGNIIAILEGVTATDIDAGDFVSLDYDLSEILEIAPSMVNLDLFSGLDADISLETNDAASAFANNLQTGSSLNEFKPASSSSSFQANAMISRDLIDSFIDNTEDLNFTSNDFI